MNTPFGSEMSALEQMLHDRTAQPPAPDLRVRVLAAVDDVLQTKKVPATKSGHAAQEHYPSFPDLVAGTFLAATALSLLLVMTQAVDVDVATPATERPRLSFAQRAEAAGITLEPDAPSPGRLAAVPPHDRASPRDRDAFHVLDARFFLQGDL